MLTPSFPHIDFDNVLEKKFENQKPAWKQLQDNIKSSYQKPKKLIEKQKEEHINQNLYLNKLLYQRYNAFNRSQPLFPCLDSENFFLQTPLSLINNKTELNKGFYAAPAVDCTQGVQLQCKSKYDSLVDDIEIRLLKTSILPEKIKTSTKKNINRFPQFNKNIEENFNIKNEFGLYFPKPFYSRPNRNDPDYFDFDLQHSINLFRKPESHYIPRGPQLWEQKLINEVISKSEAPVSAYMFLKNKNFTLKKHELLPSTLKQDNWRSTKTSYLSAALRTPSFWERRFLSIKSQIRDSNPISKESLLRNKPVLNKFTEYIDPDFEDYEIP